MHRVITLAMTVTFCISLSCPIHVQAEMSSRVFELEGHGWAGCFYFCPDDEIGRVTARSDVLGGGYDPTTPPGAKVTMQSVTTTDGAMLQTMAVDPAFQPTDAQTLAHAADGRLSEDIFVGHHAQPGPWRVKVTDVASGIQRSTTAAPATNRFAAR